MRAEGRREARSDTVLSKLSRRQMEDWKEQTKREEELCDGCGVQYKDGLYSKTHCEYCMNAILEKKLKQAKKTKLKKEKEAMKGWTDEQWNAWAATQVPDIAVWTEEEHQEWLKKQI